MTPDLDAMAEEHENHVWRMAPHIEISNGDSFKEGAKAMLEICQKEMQELKALKDKAADIAIALGVEHNLKNREIEKLKAELRLEREASAKLVETLKQIAGVHETFQCDDREDCEFTAREALENHRKRGE